jgi:hypothetical protein
VHAWSSRSRASRSSNDQTEPGGSLILPFVLLAVVIWLAWFAFAAAWLARRRDRSVSVWAIYGAILGPIALGLLWLAPHGHCQTCHMPTIGWSTTCPWCLENVNDVPRTAMRGARPSVVADPTPARSSVEPTTRTTPRPEALPARPTEAPRPFVLQTATAEGPPLPAQSTAPDRAVAPTPNGAAVADTAPAAVREASDTPTNGSRPPDRVVAPAVHRPPAQREPEPSPVTRVLATATYVTGTARLEPGRRYGIAIHDGRFQVLGPVDIDAKAVALERPVAGINVSALEGRLVVSEQTRSGMVLAFMSVAGAGIDELAGAIRVAAQDAQEVQDGQT